MQYSKSSLRERFMQLKSLIATLLTALILGACANTGESTARAPSLSDLRIEVGSQIVIQELSPSSTLNASQHTNALINEYLASDVDYVTKGQQLMTLITTVI